MPQPRKLHDQYFKKAKAEGYLARSAYKLLEIQDRFNVISRAGRVLDLGCAPGSWLQVAAKVVGAGGRVVGIDLTEVRERLGPNVVTIQADVNAVDPAALITPAGGPFDTVLSDMAPSTSGAGDGLLSARLCRRVLELVVGGIVGGGVSGHSPRAGQCDAESGRSRNLPSAHLQSAISAAPLLRPGGSLVMKILEGADYPDVLRETRALFNEARGFKPKASREVSREMYIIARGFRPAAERPPRRNQ